MLWRKNVRWKVAEWLRRQRRRIVWICLFLVTVAALSSTRTCADVERAIASTHFELRGERTSERRVLVARLDEDIELPLDERRLESVLAPLIADRANLIVIPSDRSVIVASAWSRLDCPPNLIVVGSTRPDGLKDSCAFQTSSMHPDWLNHRTRGSNDQRSVVGRLFDELSTEVPPRRFGVNFSGATPEIAASAFLESSPSGLFSGRVVFVVPESLHDVATPFGPVPSLALDAEALSTLLDDRALSSGATLVSIAAILFALLGGLAARMRRPMAAIAVASMTYVILSYSLFVTVDLFIGLSGFATLWGTYLVLSVVGADRKEAGREVRVRLASVIQENTRRRGHRIWADPSFWPTLIERSRDLIPEVHSMAIAELPPESWWVTYRSFEGMTEDEISERRRDVRRTPYRDAFREHSFEISDNYVETNDADSILVPLVSSSEVVGFWLINHEEPRSFIKAHRKEITRVANQIASEIRNRQLATQARSVDTQSMPSADGIIDASLSAMENLERDRRTLEDILTSSRVGLLMTNLFGEIIYENKAIRSVLTSLEDEPKSAAQLLSMLTRIDIETIRDELTPIIDEGQVFDTTVVLEIDDEEHVFDVRVGRVTRENAGQEVPHGLVITTTDVTSTVEDNRSKLQVVEVINTRAADLLNVLGGYANVLALSDTIDPGERALVEGVLEALQEFEGLVQDFDRVARGEARRSEETMPLSLQYTVREALRSARSKADLTRLDVSIPDRPLVARGHPESVQNAIRLLVLDSLSLAPEDVEIKVHVDETDDGVVVHVRVPEIAIPNDLLQRMLEEPRAVEGMGNQGFYAAKNYVRAGGGSLEASSSLKEGLHFAIKLPSNDS